MKKLTRSITWLHISDLHFKVLNATYDRDVVLRSLIEGVERYRKKGRRPELVFVTGDVAFSGLKEEYEQATAFFDDLLKACGLSRDRLFVIPGNHDVDRRNARGLQQSLLSEDESVDFFSDGHPQYHFNKFKNFGNWFDEYFKGIRCPVSGIRSTCFKPEVIDISGLKIGILGINSAIFSSGDQDHGRLWIGRRCLNNALQEMASFEPDLRIALLHHPTDWLHDEERSNIRNKFKANIDFILRGHLHENEAETIIGSDNSTLFVAAGASYQTRKYPNTALFVQVQYDERRVRIFPIHYIDRPREVWTVDPGLFPEEENFEGIFSFQPPPSALLKNQGIAVTEEARAFPKGVENSDVIFKTSLPDDIPPPIDIDQKFYLVHSSETVKAPENGQPGLFRIRVWLEANRTTDLNLCKRVTYQLHETFDPNIIATEARRKDFEVWLNAYGEFLVLAFVKLKDGSGYWISRYLELSGRPSD